MSTKNKGHKAKVWLTRNPNDFTPDHMVPSTEANTDAEADSTYYSEPYAEIANVHTGAARYYNIQGKEGARNEDYENIPNQPEVPAQDVNEYEDIATGYEELRRVEYENTQEGEENKVYVELRK